MSNRRFIAFARPLKCGIALCALYSLVCAASPGAEETTERMRAITTSSEAPIYVISAIPSAAATTLGDMAEQSGGVHFTLEGTELQTLLRRVRVALGTGYRLSFEPKNSLTNGAWRQIRVQVSLPLAKPSLRAIAKIGYYAPTR